jgi:hypothetical protein
MNFRSMSQNIHIAAYSSPLPAFTPVASFSAKKSPRRLRPHTANLSAMAFDESSLTTFYLAVAAPAFCKVHPLNLWNEFLVIGS